MQTVQKSTSFLIQTLDLPLEHTWKGLLNSYSGNFNDTGDDSWGTHMYLEYDPTEISEEQLAALKKVRTFETETTEGDCIMLKFRIPRKYRKSVAEPFLRGAYSEIDREYVKDNFSPVTSRGIPSTNWLILHKDKSLRKYWKDQIGVSLPANAEVWSRPLKRNEIFNYEGYINVKKDIH